MAAKSKDVSQLAHQVLNPQRQTETRAQWKWIQIVFYDTYNVFIRLAMLVLTISSEITLDCRVGIENALDPIPPETPCV